MWPISMTNKPNIDENIDSDFAGGIQAACSRTWKSLKKLSKTLFLIFGVLKFQSNRQNRELIKLTIIETKTTSMMTLMKDYKARILCGV